MQPHIPGRYYTGPTTTGALGTATLPTGTIRIVPFVVPLAHTYDRIAIDQTGAGSGNIRLAVYGPIEGDPTGVPLLLDTGDIATTGSGIKEATISLTLQPGWYWLAHQTSFSIPVRQLPSGVVLPQQGIASPGNNIQQNAVAITGFTYAAFPSTLPAPNSYSVANLIAIWMRA